MCCPCTTLLRGEVPLTYGVVCVLLFKTAFLGHLFSRNHVPEPLLSQLLLFQDIFVLLQKILAAFLLCVLCALSWD